MLIIARVCFFVQAALLAALSLMPFETAIAKPKLQQRITSPSQWIDVVNGLRLAHGLQFTQQLLSLGFPLSGDLSLGGFRAENISSAIRINFSHLRGALQ